MAVLVAASVALAAILALDLIPFLRGGEVFHWQWPYEPVGVGRALALAAGAGVYGLGAAWLVRAGRARGLLAWAALGVIALSLLATWVRAGDPLAEIFYRTVSLTATGPYTTAGMIDWSGDAWHDWPAVMVDYQQLSQHVALSPPGLPLLYAGAGRAFAQMPPVASALQRALVPLQCNNTTLLQFSAGEWAAASVGLLIPVWAALTVFPLAAVARRLRLDALRLAPLWALVPAVVMFAGSWNTVYPALSVAAFWLLLRGYAAQRGAGWWIGAGLLSGLLTFANFSMAPILLLFGLYALLRHVLNERGTRPVWFPVGVGLWFAVGLALPWALFWLLTGSAPDEMLRVAFDRHLELDRPYGPWLWMHAWEWALLGGLPIVALGLAALARWRWGDDVLPLATFGALGLLLLSGTARGETGRVWLFLMPFALLSAGQWIARRDGPAARALAWRGLWAAQGALLVALVSAWLVMSAPDVSPRPDPPPTLPAAVSADARFEPGFRLVGWSAEAARDAIVLRLNWRSDRQMTTPYFFAALPVSPDGVAGQAVVWQPQDTRYPTTCWRPGESLTDTVRLPLPESAPSGDWYISLQAFADVARPMETVPVHLPDGSQDRQVGLGPVRVGGVE